MKAVWEEQSSGPEVTPSSIADAFFREEYALNAAIAGSPKPQISMWDGIVMGGGAGVSVHGAYRLATEKVMFAMPETNIGLFPDVGGSFFLSRLPGELGTYLGLTGERMYAADLLYCGLATHFAPSAMLPEVKQSLSACASVADVETVLSHLNTSADAAGTAAGSALEARHAQIDEAFRYDTIEAILDHLAARPTDEFATATLKTLQKMSPTSMKLTLRLLREARAEKEEEPLTSCLNREYRVVSRCVTPPRKDFFEGIRAALVDKDRNPKWEPGAAAAVDSSAIEEYFKTLGERELAMPRLPGFSAP